MEEERVKGHRLTWLGVIRALCSCGTAFRIQDNEVCGRRNAALQDELMDRHSRHLAAVEHRRQKLLREKLDNSTGDE